MINGHAPILVCKRIKFRSQKDEEAFFEWAVKIECIDAIIREKKEVHLYIAARDIHDHDLRDLLALFFRYNIDMKQLAQFLTDDNKKWFCKKIMYWYKRVFGTARAKKG